ncbi:MAG: DUF58 domain-containing protein [Eubacteriales bacterium]|nr:DUF58 domain-containing protein [Eubacteriales bacterium]
MKFRKIRNILRYLFAFALNVYIMVIFHSYINFLLMIGMILFPVYSVIALMRVKKTMEFHITMPVEPMEKKDEVKVYFRIKNNTFFPIVNATIRLTVENPFYGYEGDHDLNMPMRARTETNVSYPLQMDYCGRLLVCAKQITLMDLTGMFETKLKIHEEKECLILPKGELRNQEAGQLYLKGVSEAVESKEKGYDFSEVSGIREYIPGDKLQNIHWKLSVKKDELMVKERISVSAMQLNVVVELANDNEMRLESVLELTDSITKSFVQQNLPFTLFYYSMNLKELVGTYIGNEVERQEWFSGVLYDKSYANAGIVEEMYLQEVPNESTYLYIGYPGTTEEENVVYGNQGVVAVLK